MNNFIQQTNYGQAFDPLVAAENAPQPLFFHQHPSQWYLPHQQPQDLPPSGHLGLQPQPPLRAPLVLLPPHHHELASVQMISVPAPFPQPPVVVASVVPGHQQPAPRPQLQPQPFWNPPPPPHLDGFQPGTFTQNPTAAPHQPQQPQMLHPHATLVGHPISRPSHKGDLRPGQYDPDQAVRYILNGVNPELSQETVEGLLTPYGVTRVRLVFGHARDNAPLTRSLGFAYVDFATPKGAKAAVAALNGSIYFGSELKLHVSRKDQIQ